MVSETPVEGGTDSSTSLGVRVHSEVPDAGGSGNDELAKSINEGSNPEKSEKLVPHNISSGVTPFDGSHEVKWSITLGNVSDRVNMNGAEKPSESPECENNPGEEWENKNSEVGGNILSSSLVDGDCNSDGLPAAADTDNLETSEAKEDVGRVGGILLVWVILREVHLSVLHDVETSSDKAAQDEKQAKIDDGTSDASNDEEEEVSKDKSSDSTDGKNLPGCSNISKDL